MDVSGILVHPAIFIPVALLVLVSGVATLTALAFIFMEKEGKSRRVSGAVFLTGLLILGAFFTAKHVYDAEGRAVQALETTYGVTVHEGEAYNTIQQSTGGIHDFMAEQDGVKKILWAEVREGTFTLYEQQGAEYVEVSPKG
jgi:hypothetical protein